MWSGWGNGCNGTVELTFETPAEVYDPSILVQCAVVAVSSTPVLVLMEGGDKTRRQAAKRLTCFFASTPAPIQISQSGQLICMHVSISMHLHVLDVCILVLLYSKWGPPYPVLPQTLQHSSSPSRDC